jgi:hypothetical protein
LQAYFTSTLLTLLSLALIKSSVIGMLLRIFARDTSWRRWKLCVAFMLSCLLWGLVSALTLSVNCVPSTLLAPLIDTAQCPRQYPRCQGITAVDMASELLIFILPASLTWTLNITVQMRLQLILAFAPRLPLVALSALHLRSMGTYVSSPEPQMAVADALVLQQCALTWSVMSATVPNLKNFMKSFDTGFGLRLGLTATGAGSASGGGESYALQTIGGSSGPGRRTGSRGTKTASRDGASHREGKQEETVGAGHLNSKGSQLTLKAMGPLRPDLAENTVTVVHRMDGESEGSGSADGGSLVRMESQDLIIRKDMQWMVESTDRVA